MQLNIIRINMIIITSSFFFLRYSPSLYNLSYAGVFFTYD